MVMYDRNTLFVRPAESVQPARRAGDPPGLARLLAELYACRRLIISMAGAVLGIPTPTVHGPPAALWYPPARLLA
jgi:hypothetical protein